MFSPEQKMERLRCASGGSLGSHDSTVDQAPNDAIVTIATPMMDYFHSRRRAQYFPTTSDPRLAGRAGRAAATADMTTTQPPPHDLSRPLKRRRTDSISPPSSRRKHHHLSNVQAMPDATEPAPQDAVFVQSQLLRSISSALSIVGYDTVRPSALEAFRAQVEEYMLNFLSDVKDSMAAARRTSAIPYDFTYALDTAGLSSSDLEPHLELPFPPQLSAPRIATPAPAEPPPLNLAHMLGAELHTPSIFKNEVKETSYIPAHFPPLPSRHSYLETPVFTEREKDARKIRERATEEGILAEQALRKLTAAKAQKVDRAAAARADKGQKPKFRDESWKSVMADLIKDDSDFVGAEPSNTAFALGESAFGFDGAGGADGHWRRGAGAAVG